jgi:hypothetical protein
VGIRRAVQLKNRQPVSQKTLKRMKAYFDRHRIDKRAKGWGVDSKGYQAWLLWGGDAGYKWAKAQLAKYEPNVEGDFQIKDHPAFQEADRQRTALNALLDRDPHPLKAPVHGGRFEVLVHRSTRKPGWWQATFFDDEGPYGDSESPTWHRLLEHIHMDSVDWTRAEPVRAATANPRGLTPGQAELRDMLEQG